MRAWWLFWISIVVAAILWIGVPLALGGPRFRELMSEPVGLVMLVLPLVVAGVDLILFRTTHEEVCRLEAQRHRSPRAVVGDGYSARTFLWTGIVVLATAVVVVAVAVGAVT